MRKLAFILLLTTVFTMPWEETFTFPMLGSLTRLIAYGVVVAGILSVIAKGWVRPLIGIHYVIGVFILWICLSLAWTSYPGITLTRVFTFIMMAGLTWLVWEFASTPRTQLLIMQSYIFGGFVSIAGQLLAFTRLPGVRFSGGGLDPNDLSLTLALGIPFAFYLVRNQRVKNHVLRLLCWAYCPLAAFGILLTASRTGFVVLVMSVVLIIFLHARRRSIIFAVSIIVIAVSVTIVFLKLAPKKTIARIGSTQEELAENTQSMRKIIILKALEVSTESPVIGTGAGTFNQVIGRIGHKSHVSSHNAYLSALVETGAIGLLLFCTILAFAWFYALKMPTDERRLWIVLLAVLSTGIFALTWACEKPLWLFIGLVASQYATMKRQQMLQQARNLSFYLVNQQRPPQA